MKTPSEEEIQSSPWGILRPLHLAHVDVEPMLLPLEFRAAAGTKTSIHTNNQEVIDLCR